jgi:hypothetical protein
MFLQFLLPFVTALGTETMSRGIKLNWGVSRAAGSLFYAITSFLVGQSVARFGVLIIPASIVISYGLLLVSVLIFPFSNEKKQKKADKAYKEGKYPDNVVEHQRAMDKYRKAIKDYIDGKLDHQPSADKGDLAGWPTGYRFDNLKVRLTTKGYPCVVTDEGYVMYESMILPDGMCDFTYGVPGGPYKDSADALVDWGTENGHPSDFRTGLTYKQLQKIFGKLDKNSKSITFKEFHKKNRQSQQ